MERKGGYFWNVNVQMQVTLVLKEKQKKLSTLLSTSTKPLAFLGTGMHLGIHVSSGEWNRSTWTGSRERQQEVGQCMQKHGCDVLVQDMHLQNIGLEAHEQ